MGDRDLDDRDRQSDAERDEPPALRRERGQRQRCDEQQPDLDARVVGAQVVGREQPARREREDDRDRVPHSSWVTFRSAVAPSSVARWYAAYTAFDSTVRSEPFSSW